MQPNWTSFTLSQFMDKYFPLWTLWREDSNHLLLLKQARGLGLWCPKTIFSLAIDSKTTWLKLPGKADKNGV